MKLKLANGEEEHFSFSLPCTTAHNFIIGKMYVDVQGKFYVKNATTGDIFEGECKAKQWSGNNANQVVGLVKNSQKKAIYKIDGNYT